MASRPDLQREGDIGELELCGCLALGRRNLCALAERGHKLLRRIGVAEELSCV